MSFYQPSHEGHVANFTDSCGRAVHNAGLWQLVLDCLHICSHLQTELQAHYTVESINAYHGMNPPEPQQSILGRNYLGALSLLARCIVLGFMTLQITMTNSEMQLGGRYLDSHCPHRKKPLPHQISDTHPSPVRPPSQ